MGGVAQSWALLQLVGHHLSPPWATRFSSRGFSLGLPSLSPSGAARPTAWGLQGWSWPARAASKLRSLCSSDLGIQSAHVVSLPVYVRQTKHLERFKTFTRRKSTQSMREVCPASTFTSNKSALKMYKEIKKKTGHIASVETHFSHAQSFLCIRSSVSQRKLPAMDDNGAHKTSPSPSPGLLQGLDRSGPGVQLAGCCSPRSPPGFQFCADLCWCASAGGKKKIHRRIRLHVEAPRGGCGR